MTTTERARRVIAPAAAFAAALASASAPAATRTCSALIISDPPSATVYIDGEQMGQTPLTLEGQARGARSMKLVLPGYLDWSRKVLFRSGLNTVDARLTESPDGPPPEEPPAPVRPVRAAPERPRIDRSKLPKTIEIDCLYCEGAKFVRTIRCAECRGAGGTCRKCGGDGQVDVKCPTCQGSGKMKPPRGPPVTCRTCGGKRWLACIPCRGTGKMLRPNPARAPYPTEPCPHCSGKGCIISFACKRCAGRGTIGGSGADARRSGRGTAKTCPDCDGTGKRYEICRACAGRTYKGKKTITPCAQCCGTGHHYPTCPYCRGRGYVKAKTR